MKSLSAFLLTCATLFFFIGCSDDPAASGGGTIQQLFPMAVGNTWSLQNTNYDDLGNISGIDTMSLTIDSAGTVFGHSGFFANMGGGEGSFLYYNNTDLRSQDPDNESDNELAIRYPMAANEILITEDTTNDDGYRRQSFLKLVSENTPVSVPGGTFNCVVYMDYSLYGKGTLDTTSLNIYSFAFGTGYVKQDKYYHNGSTSKLEHGSTTALIKATIK